MLMLKISVGLTYLFHCIFLFLTCPFSFEPNLENFVSISFSTVLFLLLFEIQSGRTERPKEWVPEEITSSKHQPIDYEEYSEILQVDKDESRNVVDIFSIHSNVETGTLVLLHIQLEELNFDNFYISEILKGS